jgi:cytoskeletal protein CcmA (bactofilin family)
MAEKEEVQPEWFTRWSDEVGGGQQLEEARLSLIAAPLTVKGDLTSTYPLFVAGTVTGSIKGQERVTIELGGTVHGRVEASEVFVAGMVDGDVAARTVAVAKGGEIKGDIAYESLSVQTGGIVCGKLSRSP